MIRWFFPRMLSLPFAMANIVSCFGTYLIAQSNLNWSKRHPGYFNIYCILPVHHTTAVQKEDAPFNLTEYLIQHRESAQQPFCQVHLQSQVYQVKANSRGRISPIGSKRHGRWISDQLGQAVFSDANDTEAWDQREESVLELLGNWSAQWTIRDYCSTWRHSGEHGPVVPSAHILLEHGDLMGASIQSAFVTWLRNQGVFNWLLLVW